jgi:glutamate--cysteine ligase
LARWGIFPSANFEAGAGAGAIEPQFQDWTDHLTTIFTEARLKQYIELRSADGGDLRMALALGALARLDV